MKYKASVKIMRSYDYNHFECCLSSDFKQTVLQINNMRKDAARLVDESIRQYKVAIKKEKQRDRDEWQMEEAITRAGVLKEKPKSELTSEEAAFLKTYHDRKFWKEWDEEGDYYEEDPERDFHFSCLTEFKKTRINA